LCIRKVTAYFQRYLSYTRPLKPITKLNNINLENQDKKLRKRQLINAALIGFLASIFVIGTVASIYKKNALGMIPMLIPLFLIYKIVRSSKRQKNE